MAGNFTWLSIPQYLLSIHGPSLTIHARKSLNTPLERKNINDTKFLISRRLKKELWRKKKYTKNKNKLSRAPFSKRCYFKLFFFHAAGLRQKDTALCQIDNEEIWFQLKSYCCNRMLHRNSVNLYSSDHPFC